MTPDEYEKSIPKHCALKTMKEHAEIMLCWGLAASIRGNYPPNCEGCEFNEQALKEKNA